MPEAFNVAPRQRSIPDVSSQKITTPLCYHLVAFIPLSLRRVSHLSSRSNVPFLWRTIRVCPRDRFYFAPCHLSCPVTVEHCFLWRSMLDVPIALRFSRYFPSLSLSLASRSSPLVSSSFSSSSSSSCTFEIVELKKKKQKMEKSKSSAIRTDVISIYFWWC